jgi:phenylacetaldehyde dehydrogenase
MTHPMAEATAASLARPFRMLIGDQWLEAADGSRADAINPADGQAIASVPMGGPQDIDRAVQAARQAFERRLWTSLQARMRTAILWKAADLLEARAQEFAELETLDNGKPVSAARTVDLPGCVAALRYWAGWCTKLNGDVPALDLPGEYTAMTVREPVGVVGIIIPWNFPLSQAVGKIAPALAAGCTVVVKPAEQTSLTLIRFGEVLLEAGVPPGVVNIVPGLGRTAGAALASHPDVDKLSFTGSTAVGKQLIAAAAGNLKRLTLELGGKSPAIVFADADLDKAIASVAGGIFRNAGQMCAAGSRLFVARPVFDAVIEGVAAHARAVRLGPGLDPATTMGPLVSQAQRERVLGYVESARAAGAGIAVGGGAGDGPGYFVQPTVIVGAGRDAAVSREEIFGPVLVACPFDDADEVAEAANATVYGLSANLWTRDISTAYRLASRIRAGTVTINSGMLVGANLPFGGFRQSGWGREGGAEGLSAFTETKTILTAL